MRLLGLLILLTAGLLTVPDRTDAQGCYGQTYGYGGYTYYPAGVYGHRYYPAGYYLRTPTGWYRYGYGYEYGQPYCHNTYVAPPQLYTQIVQYKEPILVPTYSVGFSPPPVDPAALPQRAPLAAVPGPRPGYQDLNAQVAAMRAEIARLQAARQGAGAPAAAAAPAGALASCVRCHTDGGSGAGKDGLTMFDKAGRLTLDPEGVAACIDAINEGRMPKVGPLPDGQKVAASRALMNHLKTAAKAPPPMPAP